MRIIVFAVPALLFAGNAAAQDAGRTNPLDPQANVPPVEFRSAFEGYRAFVEPERRDWREANKEVGAAGGHAGHRPQPETSGGAAQKPLGAPSHGDRRK